jgi:hypothetical protein
MILPMYVLVREYALHRTCVLVVKMDLVGSHVNIPFVMVFWQMTLRPAVVEEVVLHQMCARLVRLDMVDRIVNFQHVSDYCRIILKYAVNVQIVQLLTPVEVVLAIMEVPIVRFLFVTDFLRIQQMFAVVVVHVYFPMCAHHAKPDGLVLRARIQFVMVSPRMIHEYVLTDVEHVLLRMYVLVALLVMQVVLANIRFVREKLQMIL